MNYQLALKVPQPAPRTTQPTNRNPQSVLSIQYLSSIYHPAFTIQQISGFLVQLSYLFLESADDLLRRFPAEYPFELSAIIAYRVNPHNT